MLSDGAIGYFVEKALDRLARAGDFVDQTAWRQAFEIYSEAVVYRLLRDAGAGRITVERMPEDNGATPDLKCLHSGDPPRTFYVEVKTLDVVHADQRHPEMLDEGILVRDRLDKQVASGKHIAMTTSEIARYRRFGGDPDYDWRAGRISIERRSQKFRQNFKPKQFALGPTFALASLLRMPIGDRGLRPLAPFAHRDLNGGACVSGELWTVCFGSVGDPIHRSPEFEGKGTFDGRLKSDGILVGDDRLDSPGVLFLRHEDGHYRLDGIIDACWSREGAWSTNNTETVVWILCGAVHARRWAGELAALACVRPQARCGRFVDIAGVVDDDRIDVASARRGYPAFDDISGDLSRFARMRRAIAAAATGPRSDALALGDRHDGAGRKRLRASVTPDDELVGGRAVVTAADALWSIDAAVAAVGDLEFAAQRAELDEDAVRAALTTGAFRVWEKSAPVHLNGLAHLIQFHAVLKT